MIKISYLLVSLVLLSPLPGAADRFIVESEFGEESAWTEPYLDKVHKTLVRLMDNKKVAPPQGIHVSLKKDPTLQGIGGFAGPASIGFVSDCWQRDRDRLWIVAHELTNLFAHHYGGAGGYPADWWANGRSPFPEYVSCLVMEKLGEKDAAAYRRSVSRGKPDHDLYWKLHERFGFKLFSRFFALVQADGIDMGKIGAPWPHPDERRSTYTIAYLSLAAGSNLADLCLEHRIGREPDDWSRIHPEIPFQQYSVSTEEVETILAVREFLFSSKSRGKGAEHLRQLFRTGRIHEPTIEIEEDATSPEVVDQVVSSRSVVALTVTSNFGEESDWTIKFLERAADALAQLLGASEDELPERVTVTLSKDAGLGGIGGGASGASIDMISDCWPEEPFRFWILSQELAECLVSHLGGKLGGDWWGHGGQPFATFAGAMALRSMGYEKEAAWVHDMHKGKPDHEIFWDLLARKGTDWIPRFFRLLRDDAIDFRKVGMDEDDGQRLRSLYLAAYLSMACDSNLAALLEDHGIGSIPHDWESNFGEKSFTEYRITAKKVDRLIALRRSLFGEKAKPARSEEKRDRFRCGDLDW